MPAANVAPDRMQLAFGDLDRELDATRRMLERVPAEHLAWKPHAKSMSLGELALHVANLLYWQITTLQDDVFDLAASPMPLTAPESPAEILNVFDENRDRLQQAISGTSDEALGQPWSLLHGEQVIFTEPKHAVFRTWGTSHIVHHRAQLSVYLRLLDVPLPGTYGPSADEQPG